MDPHWLAELGGAFYKIKEKGGTSVVAKAKRTGDLSKATSLEEEMARDRKEREERERGEKEREKRKAGGETPSIATPGATPFRSRARRFV